LQSWIGKISPVLLQEEYLDQPTKPCRIIVEMASPQAYRVASYVESNDGKVHRNMMHWSPFIVVELPYEAMHPIALSPHVRRVWSDLKVKALLDVAVPSVGGAQAQGLGLTGKDVTVAVIDTGIAFHPDLMYPERRIVGWHDFVNERAFPYDDNGHGTHVAGIVAGNGISSQGKYKGMAPEANLVGVKVLDSEGAGNTSDVLAALEWCVANRETYNIKVVNLSLGSAAQSTSREDPLCRAVDAAWQQGLVVCVAAGNDGPNPNTINTPGISPTVITVGNLDDRNTADIGDDAISESSSRGPTIDRLIKPDLLAPGTNIVSLRAGRGYRALSGTSMATPMVSGAVAQIYQKWGNLKPDEVKNRLIRNARQMGMQSWFGGSRALQMDRIFEEATKQPNQGSLFEFLFGADSPLSRFFGNKPTTREVKRAENPSETGRPNWFKQLDGIAEKVSKEQQKKSSFGNDSFVSRFLGIRPPAVEGEPARSPFAMSRPTWFKQLDGTSEKAIKEQPHMSSLFESLFGEDSPINRFFGIKPLKRAAGSVKSPTEKNKSNMFNPMALLLLLPALL
jgi:serine protease AprX